MGEDTAVGDADCQGDHGVVAPRALRPSVVVGDALVRAAPGATVTMTGAIGEMPVADATKTVVISGTRFWRDAAGVVLPDSLDGRGVFRCSLSGRWPAVGAT